MTKHDRLDEYVAEAKKMLNLLNIPYNRNIVFHIGKINQSMGKCLKIYDGYDITILDVLFNDDYYEKQILDTLIHEMLHTVKGCFDHGKQWKHYAGMVNKRFDMNISAVEYVDNYPADVVKLLGYKYKITCENCDMQTYRKRFNDKQLGNATCGLCGSKLILEKI